MWCSATAEALFLGDCRWPAARCAGCAPLRLCPRGHRARPCLPGEALTAPGWRGGWRQLQLCAAAALVSMVHSAPTSEHPRRSPLALCQVSVCSAKSLGQEGAKHDAFGLERPTHSLGDLDGPWGITVDTD